MYACELCKERSKMKFKKGVKCCVLDIKYVKNKEKRRSEIIKRSKNRQDLIYALIQHKSRN